MSDLTFGRLLIITGIALFCSGLQASNMTTLGVLFIYVGVSHIYSGRLK